MFDCKNTKIKSKNHPIWIHKHNRNNRSVLYQDKNKNYFYIKKSREKINIKKLQDELYSLEQKIEYSV